MATGRFRAGYSASKNIALSAIDPGGHTHEAEVPPSLGNFQSEDRTLHIEYFPYNMRA